MRMFWSCKYFLSWVNVNSWAAQAFRNLRKVVSRDENSLLYAPSCNLNFFASCLNFSKWICKRCLNVSLKWAVKSASSRSKSRLRCISSCWILCSRLRLSPFRSRILSWISRPSLLDWMSFHSRLANLRSYFPRKYSSSSSELLLSSSFGFFRCFILFSVRFSINLLVIFFESSLILSRSIALPLVPSRRVT